MRYDLKIPNIAAKPTTEARVQGVIEHLYALQRYLPIIFSNIDTDNMAASLSEAIKGIQGQSSTDMRAAMEPISDSELDAILQ